MVDPVSGESRRALDESYLGDDTSEYYDLSGTWNLLRGKDIGILPGGWVAIGNELTQGACGQTVNLALRSGPDGVPAGAKNAPSMLCFNLSRSFYVNREIPVWDDSEVLTRGNPATNGGMPTLFRGFTQALNAEGDAHPIKVDAHRRMVPGSDDLVRTVALDVPAEQQHAVLPDELMTEISHRQLSLYGTMLLASNAVIVTVYGSGGAVTDQMVGRMPNTGNWRVIAISRVDRTVLYDVMLPDAPAPSGMSLTRAGDVMVPLVDGRVLCIGGATEQQPLPALTAAATAPGLQMASYPTDVTCAQYQSWMPADLHIISPAQQSIATEVNCRNVAPEERVLFLQGFLEAPATGKYHFGGRSAHGAQDRITIFDPSGRFVEKVFSVGNGAAIPVTSCLPGELHPIAILAMPGVTGNALTLQWDGPGIPRGDIPATALSHLITPP